MQVGGRINKTRGEKEDQRNITREGQMARTKTLESNLNPRASGGTF